MDNIKKIIEKSFNIAIVSHIDEDSDAFGSSLALFSALKEQGKKVTYYIEKPIEKRLSFLSDEYTMYKDEEKNKEFDLLICLDCGDEKRLANRYELFNNSKKTICIDHHYTNKGYADYNWIDGDMSSTSEMVYDLLCYMNINITKKIAEFLYCGIMGDTGCLKYSCATPDTVKKVSELMRYGIDHATLCRNLFDIEPLEVILLKGFIINNLESHYDNLVTLSWVDEKILNKFGVSEKDTGDIVDIARSVKGTQIAVYIKKNKEKTKISLRSNGVYNVAEIAEKLGGGGHKMAAGITLGDVSIDEAKKMILEKIKEVING